MSAGQLREAAMRRGRTERETCDLNGWPVGTTLRGYEAWTEGGVWTTIRITAIGEQSILARCIRHERIDAAGQVVDDRPCGDRESLWTLQDREWTLAAADDAEVAG